MSSDSPQGEAVEMPLFRREAFPILTEARVRFAPVKTYVLTSGGNDSTAALLETVKHIHVDAAVFIDTGTSLPGVEDHARSVASSVGLPLIVGRANPFEYESMVVRHGFPGPAQHRIAYIRLKERALDRVVQRAKTHRLDNVMLVTGVRRQESIRRMGTTAEIQKRGAKVWVAPIIDWTKAECRAAREAAGIGQSDVAALIHRSGECNCGAFAKPGEREELAYFFPEWGRRVDRLEGLAKRAGVPCRWGEGPPAKTEGAPGPMCAGCVQLSITEVNA